MLKRKNLLYVITLIVFIYGVYLRWLNIDRPFLYDELWGLTHWVKLPASQILMMFNNPNNHQLNSLIMKWTVHYWPDSLVMMRLHSFIAGVVITLLGGGCAWVLTRKKFIAAVTIILCSMNTGLIYYSQVARGYCIETMFIMLFLFFLLLFQCQAKLSEKNKIFIMSGMILSFCLGCFSLSTAILFLAPLMCIHTAYILTSLWEKQNNIFDNIINIIRKNIVLVSGYGLITLFAVWMYILHYSRFQAAVPSSQGVEVKSFSDLISTVSPISARLFPWFILIGFAGCLLIRKYRIYLLNGIIFIFPAFLAGIMIKYGPPRVYTPLVPMLLIIAATGFYSIAIFARRLRKYVIILLPIVLTGYILHTYQPRYFEWSEISFSKTVEFMNKYFPQGRSYHCYPPNVGMKIAMCYPGEVNNNIQKLYNNMPFLYAGAKDYLTAIDISKNKGWVINIKIPPTGVLNINNSPTSKDVVISFYQLKRLSLGMPVPEIIIADIPLQNAKIVKAAGNFLRTGSGDWHLINCWFKPKLKSKSGEDIIACQLVSDNCLWSIRKLQEIEKKSSGKIIFYTLAPVPQSEVDKFKSIIPDF